MPRPLTLAAVGFALLASISVVRADDDPSGANPPSAGTADTATVGGLNQANSGDVAGNPDANATDDVAAVVPGGSALTAGSAGTDVAYGVFREYLPDTPVNQRNCWVQGMISGDSIRGDLLAERVTYKQAQCVLNLMTLRGQCANQRTNPTWSARPEEGSNSELPDHWAGRSGSGNLDVGSWNQSHAGPGRQPHRGGFGASGDPPDGGGDMSTGDQWTGNSGGNSLASASRSGAYWGSMGCATDEPGDGQHRGRHH